jgi:adenylate kinase family enzyme
MNILEAYIRFKNQLIIIISGPSGSGKTSIAKNLAKAFNIKYINQFQYYKPDYNEMIPRPDGTEILNYNNDDALDWINFNQKVDEYSKSGVIISAFTLPHDKINFRVDYHVHLSVSKQSYINIRNKYLTEHKDKYPDEYAEIDTDIYRWKINRNYSYYLESAKKMHISKYINISDSNSNEEIFNILWDDIINNYIFNYVEKFKNSPEYLEWKKLNNTKELSPESENILNSQDSPISSESQDSRLNS